MAAVVERGDWKPRGKPKGKGKLIALDEGRVEWQWPCNLEAERKLLFSVLCGPETFGDYADIAATDFYLSKHELVWQAMLDVHQAGGSPNLEAVTDRLYQTHGLQEVGGQGFLTTITASSDVSSTFNAPTFAAIVRRTAAQRKLMQAGADLVAQAQQRDADPDEVLARFTAKAEAVVATSTAARDEHMYELRDLMDLKLPETRWIVPGLLPEGALLLASKPKIGKSWLGLSLTLSVGAGGYALGSRDHRCDMGAALYLALEDTPKRLQERVKKLLGPEAYIPSLCTIATRWPRLDKGGFRKIERWLKEKRDGGYEPRLVVIDVLGKIRPPRTKGGDMYAEDYAVMSAFQQLAQDYHVAILIIHHTRKASAEDVFDEVRDTVASGADAVMVLQRTRGEADATLHITGRDVDETALALSMDKTTCNWSLLGNAEEVAKSKGSQTILEVFASLGSKLTYKEIRDAVEMNENTLKSHLRRMVLAGDIKNPEKGTYECN